jgi:hypothetical protein
MSRAVARNMTFTRRRASLLQPHETFMRQSLPLYCADNPMKSSRS